MSWFQQHRMEWIAETLHVFGFINREHIERKFGLSTPQASIDLQEFQRLHPGAMSYDLSAKRYVAARHITSIKSLTVGDCIGEDGDQSGTHSGSRHKDNKLPSGIKHSSR